MDIVEQLRKYQCPENKGCNPVVEYCQCALMDSGADEIERLRSALSFIAMARQPNMGQTWENHAIEIADYAAEKLKEKE